MHGSPKYSSDFKHVVTVTAMTILDVDTPGNHHPFIANVVLRVRMVNPLDLDVGMIADSLPQSRTIVILDMGIRKGTSDKLVFPACQSGEGCMEERLPIHLDPFKHDRSSDTTYASEATAEP